MVESAALKSRFGNEEGNQFPLENIPFGVFTNPTTKEKHCCTRVQNYVIDLAVLEASKVFSGPIFSAMEKPVFCETNLNAFAALGPGARKEARDSLQNYFGDGPECEYALDESSIFAAAGIQMHMPMFIRDYTDFYSSKNHAFNVGCMFRGPDNALNPNWTHLPVGYHGRASSIVIDGTPIRRPKGQSKAPDASVPSFGECKRLDLELEMGTIIGKGNDLGNPIKIGDARDHIFGFTLLNDWSARDLQVWEYVPLGPFNAKNFASTISPWVVTPEALAPFKVALPAQDPELLPYLRDTDLHSYDINLDIQIKTPKMEAYHTMATSNMKYLYYSVAQTVCHHAVTGCNMSAGDMLGSGTISGKEKSEYGSMLELCWGGKETITLPNAEERKFLVDGDSINLTGTCKGNGYTIGFGNCEGTILPAHEDAAYF